MEDSESSWHAQMLWSFFVAITIAIIALQSPAVSKTSRLQTSATASAEPKPDWLSQKPDEGPGRFLSSATETRWEQDRAH